MTRQPTPADAAIRVVRARHWATRWQWVCLLCGEHSPSLAFPPGIAADDGRTHYLLWHTNEPVTR